MDTYPEGEREALLKDVIDNCVKRLGTDSRLNVDCERLLSIYSLVWRVSIRTNPLLRFQAVAFRFSNVGSDKEAMDFLTRLNNHVTVGKYVDCLDGILSIELSYFSLVVANG